MTLNTREIEERIAQELHNYGNYGAWLLNNTNAEPLERQAEKGRRALIKEILHQELQKARHDWLREEIVKTKNLPVPPYPYEGAHGDAISQAAQRGFQDALQTIIDRYLLELKSIAQK